MSSRGERGSLRQGALAARIGLAAVLVWPFLEFVLQYVWQRHTFKGVGTALVIGIADSVLGQIAQAFSDPVRFVLTLVVLTVLSRLAFGDRARRGRRRPG